MRYQKICMVALSLVLILFGSLLLSAQPITSRYYLGGIDTSSKTFVSQNKFFKNVENKDNIELQTGQLITDKRVVFSTYLGGNGYDCLNGIAVDKDNNIYVVGYTGSTDLRSTSGAFQKEKSGDIDMMIAKFAPDGTNLWLTYYGGNKTDVATDCLIDMDGNLVILGKSNSTDFPVTSGFEQSANAGDIEVVLVKLDKDGNRLWARYYGGTGNDIAEGIKQASNGDYCISGGTTSLNLPKAENSYQNKNSNSADVMAVRFTTDGQLLWSCFIGGFQNELAHDLCLDSQDNIIIVGETYSVKSLNYSNQKIYPTTTDAFQRDTLGISDCIISMLSSDSKTLIYSTLYGGSDQDIAWGVDKDDNGNIYVCGWTDHNIDFPTTKGAFKENMKTVMNGNGFIIKFNNFHQRQWATLYGGDITDLGTGIQKIKIFENEIYLAGWTNEDDFPYTSEYQIPIKYPRPGLGATKILLLKFTTDGNRIFAITWGSEANDFGWTINLDNDGKIIVVGEESSGLFPVTANASQINHGDDDLNNYYDGYISKFTANLTDVYDNNNNSDDNVLIYENKAKLYISLPEDFGIHSNIKIVDLLGKIAYNCLIENNDKIIILDSSQFSPGLYILLLNNQEKSINTKFIVN